MGNWTRTQIRNAVDCPTCGAEMGEPCIYTGKGAEKSMRLGKNHDARFKAGQAALNTAAKAIQKRSSESA